MEASRIPDLSEWLRENYLGLLYEYEGMAYEASFSPFDVMDLNEWMETFCPKELAEFIELVHEGQ